MWYHSTLVRDGMGGFFFCFVHFAHTAFQTMALKDMGEYLGILSIGPAGDSKYMLWLSRRTRSEYLGGKYLLVLNFLEIDRRL